jgi:hypothetical protein
MQCLTNPEANGFVSGHDFSRAETAPKMNGLYRLRKNPMNAADLKGHGFIRANRPHKNESGF